MLDLLVPLVYSNCEFHCIPSTTYAVICVVGVTLIMLTIGLFDVLVALNEVILPVPFEGNL